MGQVLGPFWPPEVPQGRPEPKKLPKVTISGRIPQPFWRAFGTPFGHFFLWEPPGHSKRGSGSAFKTRLIFWRILGSARRAREGFPSRRELHFRLCSQTQKGLPNGSQIGAFWAPKSELYSLWGTMCEKLVPRKLHRKKVAKSRGVRRCSEY